MTRTLHLMEAVFLGAIPVLAEPELLLPFCDVVLGLGSG